MSPGISRLASVIEEKYGRLESYELMRVNHFLSGITFVYIREYREKGLVVTKIAVGADVYHYGVD